MSISLNLSFSLHLALRIIKTLQEALTSDELRSRMMRSISFSSFNLKAAFACDLSGGDDGVLPNAQVFAQK